MAPTQPEPSPLPNPGQTFVVPGNYSSTKSQSAEGQKPQGHGQQQQGKDGKSQRLIVVSNRLPVTISKDKNGEYHFKVCLLLAFFLYRVSQRMAGKGGVLQLRKGFPGLLLLTMREKYRMQGKNTYR